MRTGVPVVPAAGWAEGEARLRRVPVSVMVIDLEELGLKELAQVRQLRAEFPHVPVIPLVSLITQGIEAAQTEGLVRAVFEKPIALEQLEDAVNAVLSGRVWPQGRT